MYCSKSVTGFPSNTTALNVNWNCC